MRLGIVTAVSLAIITAVDCTPTSAVVAVAAVSLSENSLSASASSSASILPSILVEAQSILPIPILESEETDPEDESDPISEMPIEQPIIQPIENNVVPDQQNRLMLTEEELANLDQLSATANKVGPCDEVTTAACNLFLTLDGNTCSHSTSGVRCTTRNGAFCSEDAVDFCYDFTDSSGLYCSNGSCSRLIAY